MRGMISSLMGAAIVLGATAVGAQDLSTAQVAPATTTTTGGSITDTSGPTDHSVVVGHMGLRYFGSTDMPALSFTGGMAAQGGTQALHTIGMRYWLNNSLGLEAGLGIGFSSGSNTRTVQSGGNTMQQSSDNPNFFGLGLQVALPIMVAEAKHLSIHVDPYLYLRYGTSGITTGSGTSTTDNTLNGVQFGMGANAVAELQFASSASRSWASRRSLDSGSRTPTPASSRSCSAPTTPPPLRRRPSASAPPWARTTA